MAHPIFDQPNETILTNQDKGFLAAIDDIITLVEKFHCSFHR
jgi:hypothetical protein